MIRIAEFLEREDGAVSVEWVAVTAGLIVVGAWLTYTLFADGINKVSEQNNQDFYRVNIGE